MRAYKHILILAALTVCAQGCKTTKVISDQEREAVVKRDTTSHVNNVAVEKHDSSSYSNEVVDTALGISGGDLSLLYQEGIDTTVKEGNLSLHVYTDDKGKRHATCKADSLTVVIRGLQREKYYLQQCLDSAVFVMSYQESKHDSTSLKAIVKVESKGWLYELWGWIEGILAVIGAAVVIIYGIKKIMV